MTLLLLMPTAALVIKYKTTIIITTSSNTGLNKYFTTRYQVAMLYYNPRDDTQQDLL